MESYRKMVLNTTVFVCFVLFLILTKFTANLTQCSFLFCDRKISVKSIEKLNFNQELLNEATETVLPTTKVSKLQIMFPTAIWISEAGGFLVIVRVFINERMSFLYASMFTKDWTQVITSSKFQSLELPGALPIKVTNYDAQYSGPEDARLFRRENGEIHLIFNMLDADGKRKMFLFATRDANITPMFLTNYYESAGPNRLAHATIPTAEKNWTPLVIGKSLNFVYNFGSFQVMHCKSIHTCSLVYGAYNPQPGMIKGGTPFQRLFDSDYYFSITYTHYQPEGQPVAASVYRPNLTVLHVGTDSGAIRYVFTSEPLELDNKPFLLAAPNQTLSLKDNARIMIACAIALWNPESDETAVTLNINDKTPMIAVLKGIRRIVEDVINQDQKGELAFSPKCAEEIALTHFNAK